MVNITKVIQEMFSAVGKLINRKLNVSTFKSIFCNTYTCTVTSTAKSNWTIDSASALMVGHMLRIACRATRSASTGAGDISNETVATLKINHDGKMKGLYSISTRNYDGVPASYQLSVTTIDANNVQIEIILTATHAAMKNVYIMDNIPMPINIDKY